jgi:hypothetical protein
MKVVEVDDGTQFLLCTDGITRHIPDHELRQLLLTNEELTSACEEMKRRCFERGAEDNLTAVLVSVGPPISPKDRAEDVERTISPETAAEPAIPATPVSDPAWVAPAFVPASRRIFPAKPGDDDTVEAPLNIPPAAVHERTGVERTMTRFFVLVLFIVALAGAFYAGRRYRGTIPYVDQGQVSTTPTSVPSPTAAPDDLMITFETARRQVDSDPKGWLGTTLGAELSRQGIKAPLESSDPSFLYLYGRASLLTANYEEAARAFEATIAKADLNPSQSNATLRTEATLGLTAVALKSTTAGPAASRSLDEALQKANPSTPLPVASPSISP